MSLCFLPQHRQDAKSSGGSDSGKRGLSSIWINFRVVRNPPRIDAKRGESRSKLACVYLPGALTSTVESQRSNLPTNRKMLAPYGVVLARKDPVQIRCGA